jgi:glycosyltransferase involved in cell wall biosynthesis
MTSVIIPVYKVEAYLGPCIESILNSTCKDFELILIDDGSPDGCGAICDSYAASDSRIKVIHQPNQGVSAARNAGLHAAKGDYVTFVDGDDLIHCQMLETLKAAIESGDYDFSMVYVAKIPEEAISTIDCSKQYPTLMDPTETLTLTDKDFFVGLCELNEQYHVACNKFYKRSLIEGMEFEKMVSEDTEWSFRVSQRMNRAIVVKRGLYYYLQRKGSDMHSGVNKKNIERIKTVKHCLGLIPKENHFGRDRLLKMLYSLMLLIRRTCMNTSSQKEAEAVCAEVYKETIKEFRQSDNSWLSKMRSIIGYHCPGPYNFVTKMIERAYKAVGHI